MLLEPCGFAINRCAKIREMTEKKHNNTCMYIKIDCIRFGLFYSVVAGHKYCLGNVVDLSVRVSLI